MSPPPDRAINRKFPLRVAGIITNLVPYHEARWNAFAKSSVAECFVLELSNRDNFSVLEVEDQHGQSFRRVTLFREHKVAITPRGLFPELIRTLEEIRPDAVCLNGYSLFYNWIALSWCRRRHVPAVMCSETNEFDKPRRPWKEALKRHLVSLCSSGLVGGTPHKEYLINLGMRSTHVFLGYDVVDNSHFVQGSDSARSQAGALRKQHNLPESYFVACGRFGRKKNLFGLIRAYHLYMQGASQNPWPLLIVGGGELRSELQTLIAGLRLQQLVRLEGTKQYTQLPTYFGLAGAFVHASTTEQWGLVVNEAMASGLPVLVSNRCGCVRDLVRDGVNGFAFDPYDVDQLAGQLRRVSGLEPGKREELGARSREIIADWGPERFASGLKRAFKVSRRPVDEHAKSARGRLLRCLVTARRLLNT